MLKIKDIVSSFFQLVLRVPSKLTPNTINKALEVPKVPLKKDFEVRSGDKKGALVAALISSSFKADSVTKV